MHMPGSGVNGAIVPSAPTGGAHAAVAWQRLQPERWPVPAGAFPSGTALVGGAVRDALLDRLAPQPDLDVVLPGDAVAVCRQLQRRHGGSAVVLDAERSIARLVIGGWSVDLARQEGESLSADLHRRDYTINAMALPLAEPQILVDPHGGLEHLAAGELVAISEANLLDDPLRLLRGLRLAAQLRFRIEVRSLSWIRAHHGRLGEVAGERVLAELEKLAAAPEGEGWLLEVRRCGLLRPWRAQAGSPLEPADEALLTRLSAHQAKAVGLTAVETAEALPLARLAALLDGESLQALRSSRRLQQRVERLRQWQLRLGTEDPAACAERLSEPERLRLQRQLEQDLPALLLSWPDPSRAGPWLRRWRDPEDPLFHPRAAIDGGSLQRELQLQASPQLGALLERLMLERAFGRLHDRAEALSRARRWLSTTSSDGANDGAKAPRRD